MEIQDAMLLIQCFQLVFIVTIAFSLKELGAKIDKALRKKGLTLQERLNENLTKLAEAAAQVNEFAKALKTKDETIKNLGEQLSRLKFDYAAELEKGEAVPKDAFDAIPPKSIHEKLAPLRGEWVDAEENKQKKELTEFEVTCPQCGGLGSVLL